MAAKGNSGAKRNTRETTEEVLDVALKRDRKARRTSERLGDKGPASLIDTAE